MSLPTHESKHVAVLMLRLLCDNALGLCQFVESIPPELIQEMHWLKQELTELLDLDGAAGFGWKHLEEAMI